MQKKEAHARQQVLFLTLENQLKSIIGMQKEISYFLEFGILPIERATPILERENNDHGGGVITDTNFIYHDYEYGAPYNALRSQKRLVR